MMSTNSKSKQLKQKGAEKMEAKDSSRNKTDGMKLPVVRKIHIHPAYCVLGAIAIVLSVFFIRVAVWEHNYLSAMEGSERHTVAGSDPDIVEEPTEEEEEENPDSGSSGVVTPRVCTAAANRPKYISIPSLGIVNKCIVEVGVLANGEIGTPRYLSDVGWYTGSAVPGSNGTAFLDAHGGGAGVFISLPHIRIGDTVTIEMGDGRIFNYIVKDMQEVALGNEANSYMSNKAFSSPISGVGSVTLITCTGDYWQSSDTFSHRFFVRAVIQ